MSLKRSWTWSLIALAGACGGAHGAVWNDLTSDLPNVPFAAPVVPVPGPGSQLMAFGAIFTGSTDVDFISIFLPFTVQTLIVDLDVLVSHQDSLLGIAPVGQYPTLMVNDDDLDGPIDQFCGVSNIPIDSAFDVTAFLGGPVLAGSTFTIAITRSGDNLWQGVPPVLAKLEWQLHVYTAVPAPTALGLAGLAGVASVRRRRR